MSLHKTPTPLLHSSFRATFINPTTVLILEDDIYLEQPLIYIKIYPTILLVTDTGTSIPRLRKEPGEPSLTLRGFLETVPVAPYSPPSTSRSTSTSTPEPKSEPLNPAGKKKYIIVCTHAHYDHILGIPSFLNADANHPPPFIVASGNDPSFILDDLPTHSLCKYLNIPTPVYTISHWARNLEYLAYPATGPLRIRCLQIPGHTPDSLAWYDLDEGHLFVGDTFYSRKPDSCFSTTSGVLVGERGGSPPPEQDAAIIFPAEGDWTAYMASLDLIISFVEFENARLKARSGEVIGDVQRVKVGCGHVTFAGDAEEMAREVKGLFARILEGRVEVVRSFVKRGEVCDVWDEGGRFFVEAPRRLWEEARGRMSSGL